MKSSRRNFIRNSGIFTAGLLVANKTLAYAYAHTTAPGQSIRKEVNSAAAASDLASYKKAVTVMKARAVTDPTSWHYQATIHNNFCPHNNWFFLPWHRAYLLHFEAICREACGDPDFNLPYWNWTTHPTLPAAFWGNGNPLMDNTRAITASDTALAEFVGQPVIDTIVKLPSFEDFGSYRSSAPRPSDGSGGAGNLEEGPHNYIHGFISGDMGNYMSPLDPIFWLHHANIDRIWGIWNQTHINPTDPVFVNYMLNHNFFGADGKPLTVRIGDMFSLQNLNYNYQEMPHLPAAAPRFASDFQLLTAHALVSQVTKTVNKLSPAEFTFKRPDGIENFLSTTENHFAKPARKSVKVIISDVTPPEKEDFFVRVFINCPYLSAKTPISDRHYIGSFTFFGTHHTMPGMSGQMSRKFRYVFDITNNLSHLFTLNENRLLSELNVQLISVPLRANSKAELITGKVQIVPSESAG